MTAYKGFNVPAGADPANVPQSFRNFADSIGTSYPSTAAADTAGVPDNYIVTIGTVMMYRLGGTWHTVVDTTALNTSISASATSTLASAGTNANAAITTALNAYETLGYFTTSVAGGIGDLGGSPIVAPSTSSFTPPRNGTLAFTVANTVKTTVSAGGAGFFSCLGHFDYRIGAGAWSPLFAQYINGYMPAYFGTYSWFHYTIGLTALGVTAGTSYQFRFYWDTPVVFIPAPETLTIRPYGYAIHASFGKEVF